MKKLLYICLVFTLSCNKDSEDNTDYDAETIFEKKHLPFPAYEYQDEVTDSTIYVLGDGYVFTFLPPACLNGCPPEKFFEEFSENFRIRWTEKGSEHVAIGIFEEEISVFEGKITNDSNMVWTWYNGMGYGGTKGDVVFKNGRGVIKNVLQDTLPKLKYENPYYLGIWVWNEEYTEIEYSTYPIRVRIIKPVE